MGGGQGNLQTMTDKIPMFKNLNAGLKKNNQAIFGKLAPPGSLLGKILGLNGDRPSWITDTGSSSSAPPTATNGTPLLGVPDQTKRLGLGG